MKSGTTPGRRDLSFNHLDQVMPDVDRLLLGHETVGNWSLGRICNHLTATLQASIEGFGPGPPAIVRATFGRLGKRLLLRSGRMVEGLPIPGLPTGPSTEFDARAEAEALRGALRYYGSYRGPFAPHPVFGPFTADEWTRAHQIHCAHHLSFARPNGPG